MPMGTQHTLTGLLLWNEHLRSFVLNCDGGGTWRLDLNVADRRYADSRVRVSGSRSGFDLLDVVRIDAI